MTVTPDDCARGLLEVVPQIMHVIRAEMRSQRTPDLSVPQFRVLAFISRNPGASLSAAAEHIGLTLPAMSIMVDGLVERRLVSRQSSPADRRRVLLRLTGRGESTLASAREATQARLAERLGSLSSAERAQVVEVIEVLRGLFAPVREAAES
jgi:MarR family transcriptional regulator for hemolysin